MKTTTIIIDNLKCHGCANTIQRELSRQEGVQNIDISQEDKSVTIAYEGEDERRDEFCAILKKLGYPEQGKGNTVDNIKSYMSCAIGRINS